MATIQAKEVYVTWDGDPAGWADYCRKVRLQFEKTPKRKQGLLGPELASRLTGKAWAITAELSHERLRKRHGVKYLLSFLKERLCRTAVPDAGVRLEELLMKLRRPPGMGMAQWSAMLLESYRKLQRSLVRARIQTKPKDMGEKQSEKKSVSEPQAEPPSPSRRSASGLRAEHRGQASPAEPGSPGQPQQASPGHREPSGQEHGDYETLPQDDPDEEAPWRPKWTDEEWREWYRRDRREDSDEEFSSGEDLPWDELEQDAPEVLPPEILGWLLLRRANLSSSARLSVQASVQNSLNYEDIERALRDQEEELLQGDAQRQQFRGKRTFWVEDGGEWGLMTVGEEWQEEQLQDVHWVGNRLPQEVYPVTSLATSSMEEPENEEIY